MLQIIHAGSKQVHLLGIRSVHIHLVSGAIANERSSAGLGASYYYISLISINQCIGSAGCPDINRQ